MPYPPSLPLNYDNNTPIVNVHPQAHDNTNQAIMDMANVLGANPQGSFGTVMDRLNAAVGNAVITIAAADTPTVQKNRADVVCSGVNDNQVIQNTLNTLPSSGGLLQFLNGTFNMQSATVDIGSRTRVKIQGSGDATVFRAGNNSNIHMFSSGSSSTGQLIFKDFTIDGNSVNNASAGQGIRFTGTPSDVVIENIIFTNTLSQAISTNGTRFWIVNNILRNTVAGILLNAGTTDCWLMGNDIISTGTPTQTFDAISNQGTRNKFFYNRCTSSDTGINLAGVGHIVVGNSCFLNGNSGINSGGGSQLVIVGNQCFANGRKTTNPRSNAGIRVRDHSVSGTTSDAIISNNICWEDITTYPLPVGALGQLYSVEVNQVSGHGIPDYLIISNNILRSTAPGGVPLQTTAMGTNCQVHDNIGVAGGAVSGGGGTNSAGDYAQSFLLMGG